MNRAACGDPLVDAAWLRTGSGAVEPGREVPFGTVHFRAPPEALIGSARGFGEPEPGPTPLRPPAPDGGAASPRPVSRAEAVAALAGTPLAQIEREVIEETLQLCGGSIPEAARILGVSASTLYRKRATWSARRSGG